MLILGRKLERYDFKCLSVKEKEQVRPTPKQGAVQVGRAR